MSGLFSRQRDIHGEWSQVDRFMHLVGANSTAWLDAISIDQRDRQDIAIEVAVMGDTYSHAECVCIFLPSSDKEAFQLLEDLVHEAERIQNRRWLFGQGSGGEAEERSVKSSTLIYHPLIADGNGGSTGNGRGRFRSWLWPRT